MAVLDYYDNNENIWGLLKAIMELIQLISLFTVSCVLRNQLKEINSDDFKSEISSINAQNAIFGISVVCILAGFITIGAVQESANEYTFYPVLAFLLILYGSTWVWDFYFISVHARVFRHSLELLDEAENDQEPLTEEIAVLILSELKSSRINLGSTVSQ